MNIHVGTHIYNLQSQGGISKLWDLLIPKLREALPEATWDKSKPADVFLPTYYERGPVQSKHVTIAYDWIAHRYPKLGKNMPAAIAQEIAVKEADALIAISQWTADDTYHYSGRKAVVAYPGVDSFTRPDSDAISGVVEKIGRPYVLVVGRRAYYKNVSALYQAWDQWPASRQHAIVAVGGEAPSEREQTMLEQGRWLQFDMTDDTLMAAYAGATALVYPSLYEGFGFPVLEAMRCGCPVVCGTGGALKEIIGDAAFVCEPLFPRDLARALDETLNPSFRTQKALAGYEQAEKFTWKQMATTIAEVIRGL